MKGEEKLWQILLDKLETLRAGHRFPEAIRVGEKALELARRIFPNDHPSLALSYERLGQIHFWITFVGVYAIFIPMHVMGLVGMPRRYSSFTEYEFLKTLHPLVLFVSIAAIITIATQFIFYFNLIWSMFKGKRAGDNPWEATTLEWNTTSPPPHDNFAGIVPTVYRGPYEFAVPGAPNDFVMQTEADAEVPGGNGHEAHRH